MIASVTEQAMQVEEKKVRRENKKKERERKRLERKLGKTAAGEWVNVDTYKSLVEMGFSKKRAASALRQANNDVNNALQVLQDHPEMLDLAGDSSAKPAFSDDCISDEHVAQAMSMGFSADTFKEALKRCHGDVEKAIDMLVSNEGVLSPVLQSSKDESTDSADEGGEEEEEEEEDPDVKEAVNELVPDLAAEDDEAHLNLSLEEEYSIIAEYRALILLAGYDASSLASKS